MGIEFGVTGDTWYGRGPLPLHIAYSVLDTWLLSWCGGHAETRSEHIVTRQRCEAWVQGAVSSFEDVRGDRLGVVPPQFARGTFTNTMLFSCVSAHRGAIW